MDRIFVLLLGVPVAFLLIIYRYKLKEFTGNIAWAEQYLGAGGTYNLFILIGVAVFFLSISYALGSLQGFFTGTLGPIFGTGN